MTTATATQNSIHDFEKAGLGKAPFRIVGVCEKVGPFRFTDPTSGVTMECGSPGQPMGTCKFCGQGIMECWSIRSADGKVFDVGCDCVRKTGDAGMKKVIDAHKSKIAREKRQAKGQSDRGFVDSVLADEAAMARLSAMSHPRATDNPQYFGNKTAADFVQYMRTNAGDSGMGRLVKWIKASLGA